MAVSVMPPTGVVGQQYTSYPTASVTPTDDGTEGYTYAWSLSAGSGLSFNDPTKKSPTITGTPTTAQTVTVYCDVTGGGKTVEGTDTIVFSQSVSAESENLAVMPSHYQAVKPLPEAPKKKGKAK